MLPWSPTTLYLRHSRESMNPGPLVFSTLESLGPRFRADDEGLLRCEFALQPGPRHAPVAIDGAFRHPEQIADLRQTQAGEVV